MTGRRPTSASSHHQTSPRAGSAVTTRRVTCGERRRPWLPPLGDVVPLETLALQAGGDGVVPTGGLASG